MPDLFARSQAGTGLFFPRKSEVFVSLNILYQTPEGQPVLSSMALSPAPVPPASPAAEGPMTATVAQKDAPAKPQGGCQGGNDPTFSLVLLGVMFLVFYLFLIRPQQKRQKEMVAMLNSLAKGDRVITTGGLLGTIVGLTDSVVTLEVGDKVRIKVLRSHIQGKQAGEPSESKKNNTEKESRESDS